MHIRNLNGRTPLFLAANAGLFEHILLLRQSGAHLHSDELPAAELLAQRRPGIWGIAGITLKQISERELESEHMDDSTKGRGKGHRVDLGGSAP